MGYKEIFYPETDYGGFTSVDGTIAFFLRVNSLLAPSFTVLDVGCGRGEYLQDAVTIRRNLRILKNKVLKVIGIDVDKAAASNPFVDEFRQMKGDSWPVENDSVDLIVCDNVMEHILDPDLFFSEASRVLKNRGYCCIRTPNRWSYVAMIARLIPNRFHSSVTRMAQEERKDEDVFPTFYRCNSIRKIRKTMLRHGFECAIYGHEAEPSYLSFSRIAYGVGVMHQKLAPDFLKPVILAFGRIHKAKNNAEVK